MKNIHLAIYISFFSIACSTLDENSQDIPIPERQISLQEEGLERKGIRIILNNEPYSGYIIRCNMEGQVLEKTGYLKGLQHGRSFLYFNNGSIKEQRFYIAGKKEGIHKGWWQNGNKKFEYNFENGLHEGDLFEWYENGSPLRSFQYKKGKELGTQKMWEINGKIRANYVVKNGHRYGLIGLKNCKSVSNEEGVFAHANY